MSITKIDKVLQSAAVATGNGEEFDVSGYGAIAFQVTGITTATVTFEATIDGSNWVSMQLGNVASGAVATTATADGVYAGVIAGLQRVRARISAWTTGTLYVTALATASSGGQVLADIDIAGAETVAVSTINSVAPQFDDTDKMAMSMYGKASAAGDKELLVDSSGHPQVDVLTVPTSMQGAGNPTVDSYSVAVINLAASTADQEIVADPGAGKQVWVYACFMMANTAAGTVAFQDEDNAALSGVMAVSDEGGWVLPHSGNFAMPWLICTTNKALEVDTGACTIDGILCYGIISV